MLTSDLAILRFEGDRAVPDRLTRGHHGQYVELARNMLRIYREGSGKTRQQLHQQVESLFADEDDCESRRIHSFCKLLDDVSVFKSNTGASALRLRVFTYAARFQPLITQTGGIVGTSRQQVMDALGKDLGMSWEEIERALYSDVISSQPLDEFTGFPDGAALLSRYNVAQTQAALYRAQSANLDVGADFKNVLRAVRLARLMHTIETHGDRYRVVLTGPASLLRTTTRYGIHLARFLPALLLCRDWRLSARMQTPWKTQATLRVSPEDGLTSHLLPGDVFDSQLEEQFASHFSEPRDGWQLRHEAVILHQGQATFVPDFVLRHDDGTQVLMEIVGFWTPEYLEHKRETLRTFGKENLLLAVPERSLREEVTVESLDARDDVVVYKTALKVDAVLEKAERMRQRKAPG